MAVGCRHDVVQTHVYRYRVGIATAFRPRLFPERGSARARSLAVLVRGLLVPVSWAVPQGPSYGRRNRPCLRLIVYAGQDRSDADDANGSTNRPFTFALPCLISIASHRTGFPRTRPARPQFQILGQSTRNQFSPRSGRPSLRNNGAGSVSTSISRRYSVSDSRVPVRPAVRQPSGIRRDAGQTANCSWSLTIN